MTPPIRPEQPPAWEYLMYLRDTKQNALADEYEQFLRETGQQEMIGVANRQLEFLSGRMERRIARENQNERELTEAEMELDAQRASPVTRGLGALSSLAQDIPGAEALQAGARAVAHTLASRVGLPVEAQGYNEALSDIREGQQTVNAIPRTALRLAGGGIAGAAIPTASPVRAGAIYGGLSNLLAAEEPESVGSRLGSAAIGAGAGAAIGKVADVVTTGLRAAGAPKITDTLRELEELRAARSAPLYREALEQGVGQTNTPQVQAFLAQPDIAPIVERLASSRAMQGVAPDDPRMLDAIYKVLSDQQGALRRQLAVNDPSRPNLGRFEGENIAQAKRQALEAMDTAMPAYRQAVGEFAEGSRALEGAKRGYQAMRTQAGAGGSPENLMKRGPQSLMDWLERNPEQAEDALTGALGYVKRSAGAAGPMGLLNPLRTTGRGALLEGGDLLRQIEQYAPRTTKSTLMEALQRTAITGATPNVGNW